MSKTMALCKCVINLCTSLITVLCKTRTWNDKIMRSSRNVKDDGYFFVPTFGIERCHCIFSLSTLVEPQECWTVLGITTNSFFRTRRRSRLRRQRRLNSLFLYKTSFPSLSTLMIFSAFICWSWLCDRCRFFHRGNCFRSTWRWCCHPRALCCRNEGRYSRRKKLVMYAR